METNVTERLSSLQRQKRQLTVATLVHAAQRGMLEYGLDVTVDDIASLAEVGRRTVFRHFATREELLSSAINSTADELFAAVPQYDGTDWQQWLTELTREVHTRTSGAGRFMWELKTRRLPPRLAAAYAEFRRSLQQMYAATAATLWQAAGGHGQVPAQLRQTVTAHLSPLFAQAVLLDVDGTPELAAELSATAIAGTLRELLNEPSN